MIDKKKIKTEGGFAVWMTSHATKGMKKIAKHNNNLQKEIDRTIKMVCKNPKTGKELGSNLDGFRVLSTNDKKYRIIYQVKNSREMIVYALGHRKKVYSDLLRILAQKSSAF